MGELALAARLTGIPGLNRCGTLNGLLIGHLGLAHVGLDLELPQESVHDDLQMKLTHAGDDGLARLLIRIGLEGGVFLCQLLQGDAHLLLTGLGLGLDGHTNDRLGELHGLQHDGVLLITESVTGGGVLQTHRRGDIAGPDLADLLSVVGMHLQEAGDPLSLAPGGVERGLAALHGAGVNADEAQLAYEGVGHDLEGQGGEGGVVIGGPGLLFLGLGIGARHRRNIQRGGHVLHDRVQQLLHAFVLVGGAAGHGNHLHRHRGSPDRRADLVRGHVFAFENQFHDLVVEVGNRFQELHTILFGQGTHLLGDLLVAHLLAQIIVINAGVHIHQVDDTDKAVFLADGQLDGHGVAFEPVMDHVQDVVEICAGDVHLVDVDHAGNMIVVSLTPHRLGLRLHAALGAQDRHASVQHSQRALDLHGKVHMARGVDDVDAGIPPVTGGGGGGDGDATLLLLIHPVHDCGALMRLTELVVDARVEQDPFRRGRLPGVDMSHDADISCSFK